MLGFIGIGNMGSAILKGALQQGYLSSDDVCAYDIVEKTLDNVCLETNIIKCMSIEEVIKKSDVVVMAVKPIFVDDIIAEHRDLLKGKALLSIVLGYDYAKYSTILDATTRVLFVMPNTPCLVQEGMCLLEKTNSFTPAEFDFAYGLFKSVGEVEIVETRLMKISGNLSGCAPAYVYMFIEALADGGVKHGMPRELAYKLASQTILGAGKMQKETRMHPGVLKDQVCSPGGVTIKGVNALEDGSFRSVVMSAIEKSMNF